MSLAFSFRDVAFLGSLQSIELWTPAQIFTTAWIDASSTSTLYGATYGGSTPGANGVVGRINDRGGQANSASQSDVSRRPIRKVGAVNGLDALEFNGTNNFLEFSNPIINASHSIFVVFVPTIENRIGTLIGQWAPDQTGRFIFNVNQNSGDVESSGRMNVFNSSATPLLSDFEISNTPTLVTSISNFGSNSWKVYKNDVLQDSSTISSVYRGVNTSIGAANSNLYFYKGLLCELIVIDHFVTDTIREKITGYLAHKWGFVSSLPTNHPYKNLPPVKDEYVMAKVPLGSSLSLAYRVSSESGYDYLSVRVEQPNGNIATALQDSGESNWVQANSIYTFLQPGKNTIYGSYSKDGSVVQNLDTAWIDNISIAKQSQVFYEQTFEDGFPPDWFFNQFPWVINTTNVPYGSKNIVSAAINHNQESAFRFHVYVGDFDPPINPDILWLEANFGVEKDSSGNVVSWRDRSGNGYIFSQSDPTKRPTTVLNSINSNSVINFSSSQFLSLPETFLNSESSQGNIYIVAKNNSTSPGGILSTNTTTAGFSFRYNNLTQVSYRHEGQSPDVVNNVSNQFNLFEIERNGSTIKTAINGGALSSPTTISGYSAASSGTFIGAENNGTSNFLQGQIGAIIIDSSSSRRTQIVNYLLEKYGIS